MDTNEPEWKSRALFVCIRVHSWRLYLALRQSWLSKLQLAHLSRRARLKQLEAAFVALGKRITIAIQDAA